ncbi:MAG: hypothetical protein PUC47_05985, partial [Oscillospiraceae bacterium]|nr:hypothetical protein [Oscillospiraceae bacterium]
GADNQDKKARPAGRKTPFRDPMPASSGHMHFFRFVQLFPVSLFFDRLDPGRILRPGFSFAVPFKGKSKKVTT